MYGESRQDIVSWDRFLLDVVKEYAQENDISCDVISGGWIVRLKKGDGTRFIFGLDFGLNNSASKLIARDKAATSDILALEDISHVEHKLFLRPTSVGASPTGNWESISEYFHTCDGDVVCKPNLGSSGIGVARAQTQAELEHTIQTLFSDDRAIAISPYVEMIAEYRATVLNNHVELIYKKVKEDSDDLQFNLCGGAYAQEEKDEKILDRVSDLALRAARATGITFSNIDIVLDAKGDVSVLEMNSGVMFEHYAKQGAQEAQRAENVYRKALDKLFSQ